MSLRFYKIYLLINFLILVIKCYKKFKFYLF